MSWLARPISPTGAGPRLDPASFSALADDFLDSYVCWREACEDVQSAYERWRISDRAEQAVAFAGYQAALDQEERAARDHAGWAERLRVVER